MINWFKNRINNYIESKANDKLKAKMFERIYAGAVHNRLTRDWSAMPTSQDVEVQSSMFILRNRARELVRRQDYARNAIRIIQDNVIGTGVRLQSKISHETQKKSSEKLDKLIEKEFKRWCDKEKCHTGGKYSFFEIERLCIRSVAESGEVFVRIVYDYFGDSKIPIALEVIEADRIDHNLNQIKNRNTNEIRMGIEVDEWTRPINYYVLPNHPYDIHASIPQRDHIVIPADQMIHLYINDRPNQTRGITWFASVLLRLNHLDAYESAELIASRVGASSMAFIQMPNGDLSEKQDYLENGDFVSEMSPASIDVLPAGATISHINNQRNNSGYESYVTQILRAISAGLGISYEELSHDYSKSNYSSSRLALLHERDTWRVLQKWITQNLHQKVFEKWLDQAVLSNVIGISDYYTNRDMYINSVKWATRGWDWIDPQKDINANIEAVKAGFTTLTDVIAQTGGDFEEILAQRKDELDKINQDNIILSTDAGLDLKIQQQQFENQQKINQDNQNNQDNLQGNQNAN